MALRHCGQFWCPVLALDELPALSRMVEGLWCDQPGCQVGEDRSHEAKDGDEFSLKRNPAQGPGNSWEYGNFIPGSARPQKCGPWNPKVNLAPGRRWGI